MASIESMAALVSLVACLVGSLSSPASTAVSASWIVLAVAPALVLVERRQMRVPFFCAILALAVGIAHLMANPANAQWECPLPTADPACPTDIAAVHASTKASLETVQILQYHQRAAVERLGVLESGGVLTRMERLKRSRVLQVDLRDRMCAQLHAVEILAACFPEERGMAESRKLSDTFKVEIDRAIFATDTEIHGQPNIHHLLDMRAQVVATLVAIAAWAGRQVNWRIL